MRGEAARQRVYWDSARVVTERVVRAEPDRGYMHEALSTIYAGLGRPADASASLRTAVDLYRAHGDTAFVAGWRRLAAATNLVLLGERAAAADSLALVLADSTVFFITPASARVDPFWQKLRGMERFDRAVAAK
jgi:predicted Zn-dependent protease